MIRIGKVGERGFWCNIIPSPTGALLTCGHYCHSQWVKCCLCEATFPEYKCKVCKLYSKT